MDEVSRSKHNLEALRARYQSGVRPEFVFFWHHDDPADEVGKGCLSQWHPAPFTVDGVRFPTTEHYMMYGKAKLFADEEVAAKILRAPNPRAAKALGRKVRGFDDATWKRHRFSIVTAGNHAKFSQAPELRDFLLGTKEHVIVEASPRDRIWGIGLAEDDPRAKNPLEWRGLNLLGFSLMETRDLLA